MKAKHLPYLLLFFSSLVNAGNQQYEILKHETQQMLSSAISDIPPDISSFENKEEESKWVEKMSAYLDNFIKDEEARLYFLRTVHYEALRAGLEPELVLGLIKTESAFNKYAVSSVSARGYMQIMPFWVDVIGKKEHNLFHLRTNLRYGCTILRHYMDIEKGNLYRALGRYNGSTGKPTYPRAVIKAMNQFTKEN